MPRKLKVALAITAMIAACTLLPHLVAQQASPQPAEPPLRVSGAAAVIELGAVLVTAGAMYPGPVTVSNGGVPNLTAGTVDIATNAETQLLRESVNNPDLRVILTIVESHYRIVARKSSGIRRLADLKGKKIAVPRNTSANYFLAKMLATAGLTEADITFAPYAGMQEAIKEGSIDAIAMWDPATAQAAAALGNDAITFQDPKVYRELFNLNSTATALADPVKRKQIVTFVRHLLDACDLMKSEPEKFWPFISYKVGTPVDLLEKSWPELHFNNSIAPDLLNVLEEEEKWVAKERDRTPRTRAELAKLIDPSILEEATRLRGK